MENTKKYADLSALKWGAEDFDGHVEMAFDSDEISPETAAEFMAMTQQEKIEFIEKAIVYGIEDHLMEVIHQAIREKVTEKY
jgi:hypothetical protein